MASPVELRTHDARQRRSL